MSKVMYDGKRLIAAPFTGISVAYRRSPDGQIIGTVYNINLIGIIFAYKGSPTSNGTFWTASGYPADEFISSDARLGAIQRKQDAIKQLFSQDGLWLEIQSADGSQARKCRPRVLNIDFQPDIWWNLSRYEISLEADWMLPEDVVPTSVIESASETWQLDEDIENGESIELPRSYRLTHTINAQGVQSFDSNGNVIPAHESAKSWAIARIGIDDTYIRSSGLHDLPSYYNGYNHVKAESTDEVGGSYSVTETWIVTSGTTLEDFTISETASATEGLTRVGVEGRVTGLEDSNTRYENAITKFSQVQNSVYSRATAYSSGITLNVIPLSTNIGKNPINGVISYSYEYDNRPSNIVTGAKSEVITVTNDDRGDVFAMVPVLGRQAGPILQDIGSKTAATRGLNIELVMGPSTIDSSSQASLRASLVDGSPINLIGDIVQAVIPTGTQVYSSQPQHSWDAKTGRFSYNQNWTYE